MKRLSLVLLMLCALLTVAALAPLGVAADAPNYSFLWHYPPGDWSSETGG